MDGRQRALQAGARAQLGQGQIRLGRQLLPQQQSLRRLNLWFASSPMVLRAKIAQAPPLLEQLLHHPN